MSTITISQSKSKVNTNIKIAIDDCRIISASMRDWISRCPYFCSPALIHFGTKFRPLQLSHLTVSVPDSALNTPKIRSSFIAFAEQSYLSFSLIFSSETTISEKREKWRAPKRNQTQIIYIEIYNVNNCQHYNRKSLFAYELFSFYARKLTNLKFNINLNQSCNRRTNRKLHEVRIRGIIYKLFPVR